MSKSPKSEKDRSLKQFEQAAEFYYISKFIPQYDNFSGGPILNGYTPNPDWPNGPGGIPRIPFPPPPPIPWYQNLSSLVPLQIALGDPSPQPSIHANIQSPDFHLKTAEKALASLDKARSNLKENIAELQSFKRK